MIELPICISIAFVLTTIATLLLFFWSIKSSNLVQKQKTYIIIGLIIWLILQAVLSLKNIYKTDTNSFPPKIMLLGILPTILTIILLFAIPKGRQFIDSLPIKKLTYLHIIRIPVELILFGLFIHKTVPELMTFEGKNFDILAGISAPFVAYFGFTKPKSSRKVVLVWNFIGMILLTNIIVIAIFSAPSPLQQLAFEQPNIAILNFPFSWLPTFIVPIVLFAHLTSIRHLLKFNNH